MSRKRTPDKESTETAAAAVAEPPAAANDNAPAAMKPRSFAERVGQKKRVSAADPFGIAKDNLAGVRLFESKQDRQMAIKFGEGRPEDKPSQAVIDTTEGSRIPVEPGGQNMGIPGQAGLRHEHPDRGRKALSGSSAR